MNISKMIATCGLTIAMSSVAMAAEAPAWEIWSGSLADVTFENTAATGTGNSGSQINLMTSPTSLRPSVGYMLGWYDLEVKLSPSWTWTNTGIPNANKLNQIRALIGLNWSFLGATVQDAFFIEGQVGFNHAESLNLASGTTNTANSFAWSAGVGKRFRVYEGVNYVPEFSVLGIASPVTGGTASMYYSIVPLQFSLFI